MNTTCLPFFVATHCRIRRNSPNAKSETLRPQRRCIPLRLSFCSSSPALWRSRASGRMRASRGVVSDRFGVANREDTDDETSHLWRCKRVWYNWATLPNSRGLSVTGLPALLSSSNASEPATRQVMYDEGLEPGVEIHFCTSFLVNNSLHNPSAVGHHAEVKLSSWRCRVAEPMKRVAKDSEARAVLLAISVG